MKELNSFSNLQIYTILKRCSQSFLATLSFSNLQIYTILKLLFRMAFAVFVSVIYKFTLFSNGPLPESAERPVSVIYKFTLFSNKSTRMQCIQYVSVIYKFT